MSNSIAPGARMDGLVATRVMGWHGKVRDNHEPHFGVVWFDANGNHQTSIWSPSVRMDDAFRVIARLSDLGYRVELGIDPTYNGGLKSCCITRYETEEMIEAAVFVEKIRSTLPHAICAAALEVVNKDADTL